MSSEYVISLESVSKSFPIYEKPHHRLLQMLYPGSKQRWFREFKALTDISFSVRRGGTLGVVGRNGSGKSTLLQLICGTLSPTRGDIRVRGRIAALLELGAGFNPEFTGRENVFLNGTVLGLTREEIEMRFDKIASFADIGSFIDQPVKSYSSGMYVRLAFAVAINVEPEILIVDEALSVGDEAFQRKCFAKINRIKEAGATILFVSHSAGAVTELCDSALLLDRGELLLQGAPKYVVSRYHKMLYAPEDKIAAIREGLKQADSHHVLKLQEPERKTIANPSVRDSDAQVAYLDENMVPQSTLCYESLGVQITDAHIETFDGRRVNVLCPGDTYVYCYSATFSRSANFVRFGMLIKTLTGLEIGGAESATRDGAIEEVREGMKLDVRFEFKCMLAAGVYFLNAGVIGFVAGEERFLDRRIDIAMFKVMPEANRLMTGLVDFSIEMSVVA